jgi:hypothetical protein
MSDDNVSISGVVTSCEYRNRVDLEFSHPYVVFRTDEDSHRNLFITGQNKPPIMNGQFVKGSAVRSEMRGGLGNILIVRDVVLFDRENGKTLANYNTDS